MENTPDELLLNNIENLGLSRSAKHFFEVNKVQNLQELFKVPMANWFSFTGFSQHLLNELMNYFEQRDLFKLVTD